MNQGPGNGAFFIQGRVARDTWGQYNASHWCRFPFPFSAPYNPIDLVPAFIRIAMHELCADDRPRDDGQREDVHHPDVQGDGIDRTDLRTDEALMLAYRDGDAGAFESLYGRWRGRLFRYLAHQAADVAEELFQDVWMRVVGARVGYVDTAKFSTWLFRIAHNRLVDHHRARGRSIIELSGDGPGGGDMDSDGQAQDLVDTVPAPEHESPAVLMERQEAARHILDCLAALPLPQQEAFLMSEEGGMSLEDIANATGVGRETAKSRLRYALDRLRRCLAALKGTD